jgi:hypothetical protein
LAAVVEFGSASGFVTFGHRARIRVPSALTKLILKTQQVLATRLPCANWHGYKEPNADVAHHQTKMERTDEGSFPYGQRRSRRGSHLSEILQLLLTRNAKAGHQQWVVANCQCTRAAVLPQTGATAAILLRRLSSRSGPDQTP